MHVIVIIAMVLFIAGCIIGWGGFFLFDFPHNMDIDSRYILNLDRKEFAKELQQLFDADKIAYVELVVATDARNTRRIVVLTDPTRADKMSQITISLFDVPEKEARRIIANTYKK